MAEFSKLFSERLNVMFEKASRLQLRFESPQGLLTVEDLWALPLTSSSGRANLDDIAKGLNKKLKDTDESFVEVKTKEDDRLQLSFDIVKYIIGVRISERADAQVLAERKRKKEQLLELIANKQNEELAGKSLAELQAMVESL